MAIEGTRCCRWYAEVSPVPGLHGQHRIAYRDMTPENTAAIFVVNEDGSGRSQLTAGPTDDWAPTWSPDGGHIAYYRGGDGLRLLSLGEDSNGSVWVEDDFSLLETGFSIPNEPGVWWVWFPSFSKAENKIYFTAEKYSSTRDIWALQLDFFGSVALEQLTASKEPEHDPTGSADDSRIAYTVPLADGRHVIHVANSDGSNPVAMPKGRREPEVSIVPAMRRKFITRFS